MTLNDVMAVTLPFSHRIRYLSGPITLKWLKIHGYFLRRKCSPKNLVFSDVSLMAIFAEVTENEGIINRHLSNSYHNSGTITGTPRELANKTDREKQL